MTQNGEHYRCGFVAVVGRPNVGKSTLINAVLGSKISIVSPKPQTTRHRILAVQSTDAYQLVFIDTPGLHRKADRAMNRMMNRTAAAALADADVILFVCEADRWKPEDQDVLERIKAARAPAIAVMNKVDRVHPKSALLEKIAAMSTRHDFAEIVPISARRKDNVDRLLAVLPDYVPESPPLYPDDIVTDRGEWFRVAELIREKLTLLLRDELPYGLTVQVERLDRKDDRVLIHAVIWVERDSQKRIVIGKGGSMLKEVGSAARVDIARQLGERVHLELWVKVKDNWADSDRDLKSLGFDTF